MSDFDNIGLELFALQQSSHQQKVGVFKCPKCNADHEYQPALNDENEMDCQVFSSGHLVCSNSKCSDGASRDEEHALFALGICGHVLCGDDFKKLGGKVGEEASQLDCPTCTKEETSDRDSVMVSHGARVVLISGNEPCPICWEDFSGNSSMIALSCGHIFCIDDFKRLGGKIGRDAMLSLEELIRQRQEQVRQLQAEYGTTIHQLIERIPGSDDAESIGNAMTLLALATNYETGDAATFLQHEGPAVTVQTMLRFRESRLVMYIGSKLLGNLLCTEHRNLQEQSANSRAVIEAGAVPLCVDILEKVTSIPPILGSIAQSLLLPMFQSLPFIAALPGGLDQLKTIVSAILLAMKRNPGSAMLQGSFINVLKGATWHFEQGSPANQIRIQLAKLKGMEAIVAAMRRFPDDAVLQEKAIGALCHIAHHSKFIPRMQQIGAIAITCKAMQDHVLDYYLQRNSCNFLWAVANCPKGHAQPVEEDLASNQAVQHLQEAMTHYLDSEEIQTQACSALENTFSTLQVLVAQ